MPPRAEGRSLQPRSYHAWIFLAALPLASAWQLSQRPRGEFVVTRARVERWAPLVQAPAEEFDEGLAHRYVDLAPELKDTRDVGYFNETSKDRLWAATYDADAFERISRYYMAQSILAPSLLHLEEKLALVVVDCATPEQAEGVVAREGLTVVRDHGRGLVLARPGSLGDR